MGMFNCCQSKKSALQANLDREQVKETATVELEECTASSEREQCCKLFNKAKKPAFQVDLIGGWSKP
jgi:hypothetical protein